MLSLYALVSHVLELGMLYHSNKKSGEVLSVLGRGGTSMASGLDYILFKFIPLCLNMAGSAAVLASHFGLPVISIIVVTGAVYLLIFEFTKGRHIALQAEYVDRSDGTAAIKNESITNVELLKYFGMEPYEINRYSTSLLHTGKADWDWDVYAYTVQLLQDNVQVVGTLAGAWLIVMQVYNGEQEVAIFVMYLTYHPILRIVCYSGWLAQWTNEMITSTDKLMKILDEKNDIVDAEDAVELYDCSGQISFENGKIRLCKKTARKALDNVSFTVEPGQHVALVGETGSGKSTIFKLLYRFFEPQEGTIRVEGKDIRQYTQRSLRQALGIVQQEGMVFNDSIFYNIKFGDLSAPDEKVMQAAKMAQIHDKIMDWPKGYQTLVGERGVKLSGGEKQRVNIARTILKDPKVLLLDEATSALDSNTEKAIQGQLRQLTRGKTTISIAHRLSTIAHADKIVVLDKGKIVETGTHDELIKVEDGFYRKLWEAQSS
ncbi:P-loop containing nucleoside triphosphate hydrolase protein [Cystobasidium minutum MCA 4210]|uniref:P-loop containing nucleoside triphosphate hydrolase protein n=1 Tax=Cystobasidium minutum MCA 4210 TaxID=1397322 RepID=UPI0034CDE0A7|eukprot:jgi/Rhomi1/141690/e_gw1.2.1289.1